MNELRRQDYEENELNNKIWNWVLFFLILIIVFLGYLIFQILNA